MMTTMHVSTDDHEMSLAIHVLLISDHLIYPKDLCAINHSLRRSAARYKRQVRLVEGAIG